MSARASGEGVCAGFGLHRPTAVSGLHRPVCTDTRQPMNTCVLPRSWWLKASSLPDVISHLCRIQDLL